MNQTYKVQVSMNQASIVQTDLVFKQGDFGFQIAIEILDFDLTGVTPQIVFRKPTGAVESTSLTLSGTTYTYTIQGTELDTPGTCICDIKLKNSTTQRISTASFMYSVDADTLDGLNEHASSYSDTIEQIWTTLQDYSEDSEAWAVGTKNGVPVDSQAPQHANNAKWYATRADSDAQSSQQLYTKFVNAMGIGTFLYQGNNGHLYYTAAPQGTITFSLSGGHLMLN